MLPSTTQNDNPRFDLAVALVSGWFIGGLYLDGWAHNHIPSLETFFTPWHAILYSGFFALAGLLLIIPIRQIAQGRSWSQAIPNGYQLSIWGVLIFFVGGLGDMLWHILFGVEQDLEAIFSPTHLVLIVGMVLMITGPLRAAWSRPQPQSGKTGLLPVVLTLLYLLSLFTFITQFANILISPTVITLEYPLPDNSFFEILAEVAGIVSILIPAALTMGLILLALRRWTLPIGSLTLIIGGNSLLMYLMRSDDIWRYSPGKYWPMVLAPLAAGLFADVLLWALKPSPERATALRIFAFVVPFVLYVAIIVVTGLIGGLWWKIHMILGVPAMAGFISLGLSYLVVPPLMER
jgi:hypothetical protein